MGILTKSEIMKSLSQGELSFEPAIDQFQLQPAAIDVRVGLNFFIPKTWAFGELGRTELSIDHMNNEEKSEVLDILHLKPGQTFELLPGEFILISTLEKISIYSGRLMAVLYPRSSTTRRGISIESGIVDPYYSGFLTIPVSNMTKTQKIRIYPGERIAQLVFQTTENNLSEHDSAEHGLSKPKYQGVEGYQLDYKFDPHDEINLLRDGAIDQIKKKYPINIPVDKTKANKNDQETNQLPLSA